MGLIKRFFYRFIFCFFSKGKEQKTGSEISEENPKTKRSSGFFSTFEEDSSAEQNNPLHVALIMDGNGRYALEHNKPRSWGHQQGASRIKEIVLQAKKDGVRYLSLYAFSTENWLRSKEEVDALMHLFADFSYIYAEELKDEDIRLRFMGDRSRLPHYVQKAFAEVEKQTEERKSLDLILCVNYSGRSEILRAVNKLLTCKKQDETFRLPLTEKEFLSYFDLPDVPDPDLLIRTSGELRISNFMLWQLAYTEFVSCSCHWPAFDKEAWSLALRTYRQRQRRFGRVEEVKTNKVKDIKP